MHIRDMGRLGDCLHRGHLSHRHVDQHEAYPADQIHPDDTGGSAVDESNGRYTMPSISGAIGRCRIRISNPYLSENSHDAMRIIENPKMDKKRKFLWVDVSIVARKARVQGDINLHLLHLAHTVHIGTILRVASFLVDAAIVADVNVNGNLGG